MSDTLTDFESDDAIVERLENYFHSVAYQAVCDRAQAIWEGA